MAMVEADQIDNSIVSNVYQFTTSEFNGSDYIDNIVGDFVDLDQAKNSAYHYEVSLKS